MGVTGLWTVVQPCARPIKIETLNKKRLAVDASIWIYQFLKAVRDKEGNALRNSHVVGFFRRICKLLFFGIKPVFVFDGGAPILKRQTVSGRKARREGRREDAVRTAGKLLAVQMQRRAEEDDRKRREERDRPRVTQEEEEVPENLVYVDELQMTEKERQQNRTFKKKDAYHLPNLDVDLADMGAPNDPRIMSHEELEEYARQFHTGEDVNIYDFSKIDFNSPFFLSLPASDRYNILNAARLRSRLRMGYSKEQLDTMFPDRMAFSRFQIDRVKERNELTQRLMNLNGMNGEDAMLGINNGGRVAGEKGKEYVLVKNDGVEGGWALGVVSNKGEGERSKPIDVEGFGKEDESMEEDEAVEDDGFEDVPIEGLNRLPRRPNRPADASNHDAPFESVEVKARRRALYEARMKAAGVKRVTADPDLAEEELDSLFVPQQNDEHRQDDEDVDDLFEDVLPPTEDEEDDLNRAIAMSLESPENDSADDLEMPSFLNSAFAGPRIDQPLEFNNKNAKAGRDFAHLANARAHGSAPKPFVDESDDENDLDLQATLAESRRTIQKPQGGPRAFGLKEIDKTSRDPRELTSLQAAPTAPVSPFPTPLSSSLPAGFDGPLPFESLNLGTSILGRKKQKAPADPAGGFEKESDKGNPTKPLPPWFSGDIREATAAQKVVEEKQYEGGDSDRQPQISHHAAVLKRQETGEVIDLEAPREDLDEIIDVESSDEGDEDDVVIGDTRPVDPEVRMGDVADLSRAEPPSSGLPSSELKAVNDQVQGNSAGNGEATKHGSDSEEPIDWSESEPEEETRVLQTGTDDREPAGGKSQEQTGSPSPELEYVGVIGSPILSQDSVVFPNSEVQPRPCLPRGQSSTGPGFEDLPAEDEDLYSDPEEEDLMRQLAIEAEEHARFASTLNSKSQLQNAEDYEKELRQLRNQQKKDRRDADEVTHIMVTECQQLLKLFGLPYVTAPMEAEAQCAELVNLGIVDGIVTDDSDVFLFGGTRVYKNMFNQAKFVECYLSSDLEKEYSLDRQKLIRIAHLLGSDYTEGLPNVGPVTALEILSEFETLDQFSEWWGTVQMGQKLSAEDAANPFRRKFRKNASKLFLPAIFPDQRVDQAYLHPEVDKDPSPFQWGVPDLDALRSFLMATIGWSQERTDEVLVPVIKDMNRRENEGTQANITQFFGGGVGVGGKANGGGGGGGGSAFAPRRRLDGKSKRMETALGRLHEQARNRTIEEGETNAEVDAEPLAVDAGDDVGASNAAAEPRKKSQRKSKKRAAPVSVPGSSSDSDDEHDEYQAPSKSRKRGHSSANGSTKGRKKGKAQL
ncbi:MAG: DNA repair protein rad2 [Alectoria sarmentosa]|nr:MAG: DNA repair protein rad2 [Alectoria sarmentosa]